MPLNPISPSSLACLDPLFVDYYNENLADKRATHQVPLKEVRENPQQWARKWAVDAGLSKNSRVQDWAVPVTMPEKSEIQVRVYYPSETTWGSGPYAVHVNFHGGGWVFGDLSSDGAICLRLSNRLPIVVVDVDYRLCPEHPFGTNIQDAWAALLWVRENASALNIDPASMSIGGISAGAHLACILTHFARDVSFPLRLLIAAIPPLADHHLYTSPQDSPWPSYTEMKDAAMLNWDRMGYLAKMTFPADDAERRGMEVPEWWISPLRAPDFRGLCDAFVSTAECDPLRDEGEGYARKLVEAGNRVTMRRYIGVPHSFMHLVSVLPQARQYEDDVVKALRGAHALKTGGEAWESNGLV